MFRTAVCARARVCFHVIPVVVGKSNVCCSVSVFPGACVVSHFMPLFWILLGLLYLRVVFWNIFLYVQARLE